MRKLSWLTGTASNDDEAVVVVVLATNGVLFAGEEYLGKLKPGDKL
jgi:hypothetical protein